MVKTRKKLDHGALLLTCDAEGKDAGRWPRIR